ncbi:MAG: SufE family protein [Candidatus Dadabacteria bacterium]|nr:SufE family protein [Candidatus Dadabacteria bacterium]NIQ16456.1 SufE family protein [Candidatus Dadabacteria bacterium]
MSKLHDIIENFKDADYQETLEMLIDYSETLPSLPQRFIKERDEGLNRVHECETPVFIWVELNDHTVDIFADVPPESPTVRGLVSILVSAFDGESSDEVLNAPVDLLSQLGLAQKLGIRRVRGLSAVYSRIKDEVKKQTEAIRKSYES